MTTSFEVGSVFKIVDEVSPKLRKMLGIIRDLKANIDGVGKSLSDLGGLPGFNTAIAKSNELAGAWSKIAETSAAATKSISSALAKSRAGFGGGGAGGGGAGLGGLGGGKAHSIAMGAAGLLGYGVVEQAKLQDVVTKMIYTAGLPDNDQNRKRFGDIIKSAMSQSGYSLSDVANAALQEVRMMQGTPGGGVDVLPELLRAAATEARLKGSSLGESMTSLLGLAHMTKSYSPEAIKKLFAPFAFLSTANPGSLAAMERAASYAVPILQSGLEIDPLTTLLLGTVMTRAGATNTKSGTWLRNLAMRAMPGTSPQSQTSFRKHEAALQALGLVDAAGNPTWFTGGKPDMLKLLDIAGANASKIPLSERAGIEQQVFGSQGAGAFALLTDQAVHKQIEALRSRMASPEFQNRYQSFMQNYSANSPVQKFRQTMADFTNVMMDLGSRVLPPVTGALKEFDTVIRKLGSLLPGYTPSGKEIPGSWGVGKTAVEGAGVGAVVGSFVPGFGTMAGAGIGAATGAAAAAVHDWWENIGKSGTKADSAAKNVNKLTGAITGLGAAAAGAGGVFPGGTSLEHKSSWLAGPPTTVQPTPVSLSLNIDGRTLAQAISDQLGRYYTFPTGAPSSNGAAMWASGRDYSGDL